MVLTYAEPKKGLPKFYFTQPLGNPTYTSPNLATLVTNSDSDKLSIDIIILEYFIPIFITWMLYALHVARLSGQDRRSCSVMAVISGSSIQPPCWDMYVMCIPGIYVLCMYICIVIICIVIISIVYIMYILNFSNKHM